MLIRRCWRDLRLNNVKLTKVHIRILETKKLRSRKSQMQHSSLRTKRWWRRLIKKKECTNTSNLISSILEHVSGTWMSSTRRSTSNSLSTICQKTQELSIIKACPRCPRQRLNTTLNSSFLLYLETIYWLLAFSQRIKSNKSYKVWWSLCLLTDTAKETGLLKKQRKTWSKRRTQHCTLTLPLLETWCIFSVKRHKSTTWHIQLSACSFASFMSARMARSTFNLSQIPRIKLRES